LVLVGSCLFVREADNSKLIHLSWPEGFASNEAHDILDESGKTVARIDEIVALGGGGSDWSNIDPFIRRETMSAVSDICN
jgi:hypothetical protein